MVLFHSFCERTKKFSKMHFLLVFFVIISYTTSFVAVSDMSNKTSIRKENRKEPLDSFLIRLSSIGTNEIVSQSHSGHILLQNSPLDVKNFLKIISKFPIGTHVFLQSSKQQIWDFFEKVNATYFGSNRMDWIVFPDESISAELSVFIREGINVLLFEPLHTGFYVYQSSVSSNSPKNWKIIGSVTSKKDLYKLDVQHGDSLEGRHLKIAANHDPVFIQRRLLLNGTLGEYEGLDYNNMMALSEIFKFSFEVVASPDYSWGSIISTGEVTGLVGMVARHEAHLAINEIAMTQERESVIDYTLPYYSTHMSLTSAAPQVKDQSLTVTSTYTVTVWVLIFVAVIIIGLLLKVVIISKSHVQLAISNHGTSDCILHSLRILLCQDWSIDIPSSQMRFIASIWMISAVIITVIYRGKLVSNFASVTYEKPIDSLEELLVELKKGRFYPTVHKETAVHYLFSKSPSGIYHDIHEYFIPEKSFMPENKTFPLTAKGEAVVLVATFFSEYMMHIYGRENFHEAKEKFFPTHCAVVMPTGASYADQLTIAMLRLKESGIVDKWLEEAMRKEIEYGGVKSTVFRNAASKPRRGNKPIHLQQIQAAFYLLTAGIILSSIAFIVELTFSISN